MTLRQAVWDTFAYIGISSIISSVEQFIPNLEYVYNNPPVMKKR